MKYLLPRRLYHIFAEFNPNGKINRPIVENGCHTFCLTTELHRWLEEQKIPYRLDAQRKHHALSNSREDEVISASVFFELSIDMDPESLILFKLTWG